MWNLVILLIGFSNIIMSNGRLLEKSTKQTVTDVIPRLVNRQAFRRDVYSQDFNIQSIEQQNRQKESKLKTVIRLQPLKRFPRLSDGDNNPDSHKSTTSHLPVRRHVESQTAKPQDKVMATTKKPLVKTSISKLNKLEMYDDYHSKVVLSPMRPDNMEHEDEDFSVDDYDFDAAHDEFSGRGKPLVPRQYKKPPKKQTVNQSKPETRNPDERKEKKTGGERKVKKSADFYNNLGIINIPDPAPKSSSSDSKLELKILQKDYNAGSNKELVGLASREGVYDFVFYKK